MSESPPLTAPMEIVLIDCMNRESLIPSRSLYPYGQWRLIRHGLIARDLLDPDTGQLTPAGVHAAAGLVLSAAGQHGTLTKEPSA